MKCLKCGKEMNRRVMMSEQAPYLTWTTDAPCDWCIACCLKAIDEAGKPKGEKMTRAERLLADPYERLFGVGDVKIAQWEKQQDNCGLRLKGTAVGAWISTEWARAFAEWILKGLEEVEA